VRDDDGENDVRFVAAVSHELRSPLHAVLGLSELLADADLTPDQRVLADAINAEAESMRVLIDDILDLARLSSGRIELRNDPFSPVGCISGIVDSHRLDAEAKGVALLFEWDPEVPRLIRGDVLRYGQIARNLVSNAVRYTDEGSIRLRLRIESEGRLVLSVTDTGIGIPADRVDRVFDPFVRLHPSHAGGTGLGLAISKRLAAVLEGRLTLTSVVDEGSVFELTIPYVETDAPQPVGVERLGPSRQGRVLVVEDSPVNQMLAMNQLATLGIEAHVVATAEEAYRFLAAMAVDAILMDWNLPGADGLEATAHTRPLGLVDHDTPIVAMTANALAGDRERCIEAGMSDFLAKPVGIDDLRLVLDRWLDVEPTPGTDFDTLERLAHELGDPALVVVLVNTYLDELASRRDALGGADLDERRRAAHTLKSTSRLLGADGLAELCGDLESENRPAKDLVDRIDGEIGAVVDRFTAYVEGHEVAA